MRWELVYRADDEERPGTEEEQNEVFKALVERHGENLEAERPPCDRYRIARWCDDFNASGAAP